MYAEHILECCRREKDIQGSSVCDVEPREGVCSELDEKETDERGKPDGGP